jgi:predicted transporter
VGAKLNVLVGIIAAMAIVALGGFISMDDSAWNEEESIISYDHLIVITCACGLSLRAVWKVLSSLRQSETTTEVFLGFGFLAGIALAFLVGYLTYYIALSYDHKHTDALAFDPEVSRNL